MSFRIIFLGSPDFTIPSLEALFEDSRFKIVGVFSQPDKKFGRKQIMTPSDIKKRALELNLAVFTPENINTPENVKLIQELKPDLFFSFAYGQIISNELLAIPKIEPINLHVSLLPKYRGASPVPSFLLSGDKETGVTFIRMIDKMDAGAMFYQEKIKIEKEDNAATLFEKMAELGRKTTADVLANIAEEKLEAVEQNENEATYCKKITKADGEINWETENAEEVFNKIRAYTPWPGCFTKFEGKTLKIIKADYCAQSPLLGEIERGTVTVLPFNKGELEGVCDSIQITTKYGTLIPKIVQLEGKKTMPIEEFIKGKTNLIGSQLG